jgi:hypothetical protein
MMMPTLTVATAHAFVLTVSHDLLFRQPPFTATTLLPPLPSNLTRFASSPNFQFHQLSSCGDAPRDVVLVISDLDSSPGATCSESHVLGKPHFNQPAEFQYGPQRAPIPCALNP